MNCTRTGWMHGRGVATLKERCQTHCGTFERVAPNENSQPKPRAQVSHQPQATSPPTPTPSRRGARQCSSGWPNGRQCPIVRLISSSFFFQHQTWALAGRVPRHPSEWHRPLAGPAHPAGRAEQAAHRRTGASARRTAAVPSFTKLRCSQVKAVDVDGGSCAQFAGCLRPLPLPCERLSGTVSAGTPPRGKLAARYGGDLRAPAPLQLYSRQRRRLPR